MPSFEPTLIGLIGLVFMLGGFVKGVVGLGLPTITMGLLSLAMAPAQAAALLVVPSLVTNVWQIAARAGLLALARRLATMLAGVCGGVAAGAGWLSGSASGAMSAALGVALFAYAALGLRAMHFQVAARHEHWLSPLVGVATGLVTAATGGPPCPTCRRWAWKRRNWCRRSACRSWCRPSRSR
jgi:hypothetical protein